MANTSMDEDRRQVLLNGISQNIKYTELAALLGVRRRELITEVKTLQRNRDPDLEKARRLGQAKKRKEELAASRKREENFYEMTGMTFQEKSFQNMVYFFKRELLTIVRSRDQEAAIRNLPKSTRRTMVHNGILIKRKSNEITQKAVNQLKKIS
jgi:hypothetical protein